MALLNIALLQDPDEEVKACVRGKDQGHHAEECPYRKPRKPEDIQHGRHPSCL